MAEWTNIATSNLEPGKPARSIDALALRDNPIAIAEGAAGAPKIEDAALDTTVTSNGINWVNARVAGSNVGSVGTYAWLAQSLTTTTITTGSNYAGSGLRYFGYRGSQNASSTGATFGGTPSGTWKAMGSETAGGNLNRHTLFLRIS